MGKFLNSLPTTELLKHAESLVRVVFILLAAYLSIVLARRLIKALRLQIGRAMSKHALDTEVELGKRADTIAGTLQKLSAILITIGAAIMSLRELGFDVMPLLAGAGVAGLAVGFGAQSLVKDVISGFFMIIENQMRVGDVVTINNVGGVVEEIHLRTTVLRDVSGVVHIIPNGSIGSVSNRTMDYSYYVFDVGVAYKEDTDRVTEVLRETGAELVEEEHWRTVVLEPLEILGVDLFGPSAVTIKARLKTVPGKQWEAGREMNRRIKKRFDALGIEIPFPHMSMYFGEASKPIQIRLDSFEREELRKLVREVLDEAGKGPEAVRS